MSETPPPPPSDPPEPAASSEPADSSAGATAAAASSAESTAGDGNRGLMIVLAYFGPLALIPLLTAPDDAELQWHAKHGLVFIGAEILFCLVLSFLSFATGGFLGCVLLPLVMLAVVAFIVIHVVAIVQGVNGKRFLIPGISPLADRF